MTLRSLLVLGLLSSAAAATAGAHRGVPAFPRALARARLLVLSPHPDDATLGAGGLMQRVIHEGGTVRVVQLTDGEAFPRGVTAIKPLIQPTTDSYRWYGSLREHEAVRALRQLGVHRSQIRFLGFPDEGLCVLASTHRASAAFESPYTKRESPPDSEQIVPGTKYRGNDLVRELTRLVEEFRPTMIVSPHPGDEHPDHCATHLLLHQALAAVDASVQPPRLLHYIIHYPKWPSADVADAPLEPPSSGVLADESGWMPFVLTPAERTGKGQALGAYRSQMLVMAPFLRSLLRTNELFVEHDPLPPVPCWCAGENIATPPAPIR